MKCYWHIIYVRQKYERGISAMLDELGVENLLPLVKTVRVYKSQKRRVVVPLFPGYLFLKVCPGKRQYVTGLNGVYGFAKMGRRFLRVKDREVENIRILSSGIDNCSDVRAEGYKRKGVLVEVREGPLSGVSGLVAGNNANRILVSIDSIRTTISMSVLQGQVGFRKA